MQQSLAGGGRLKLFGQAVCRHAFRSLLGLGGGRFRKIHQAVTHGSPVPRDGRFVRREFTAKAHENRVLVAEFLSEIYNTISEPLPEQHGVEVVSGDLGGLEKSSDKATGSTRKDPKPRPRLRFRKHRGRRPKVVAQAGRKKDKSQLRMLPPGTYSDYLNLLRARFPEKKISLKLFCKVPPFWIQNNFLIVVEVECRASFLNAKTFKLTCVVLRNRCGQTVFPTCSASERKTQHATCSTCSRHKCLLRRLTGDRNQGIPAKWFCMGSI